MNQLKKNFFIVLVSFGSAILGAITYHQIVKNKSNEGFVMNSTAP